MMKKKEVKHTAPEPVAVPEKLFVSQIAASRELWEQFNKTHFEAFDSLTQEARMRRIVMLAPGDVCADDEQGRAIRRSL